MRAFSPQDIFNVREAKTRRGINAVLQEVEEVVPKWVQLDNIGSMEVYSIRTNFFESLDSFRTACVRYLDKQLNKAVDVLRNLKF